MSALNYNNHNLTKISLSSKLKNCLTLQNYVKQCLIVLLKVLPAEFLLPLKVSKQYD